MTGKGWEKEFLNFAIKPIMPIKSRALKQKARKGRVQIKIPPARIYHPEGNPLVRPSSSNVPVRELTMIPRRLAISARQFTQNHAIRAFSSSARIFEAPPEGPSLVKSFLYGTEKGQELQREMEQSYSKVLARGKYVHKLNQHIVRPDKIDEYVALMYSLWEICG